MSVVLIALAALAVDLYTKALAVSRLAGNSFPVSDNILNFTYVENTGAAFGMLKIGNVFLIISTVIILAAVIVYLTIKKPKAKAVKIASALIIGGALGNLYDRIFRGFVVDFIDIRFINYPVFNIADCCVVCGAIIFAVWVIFFDKNAG